MNQMDQVTQVNATTSEEAAAAAQELSAQATQLAQTVDLLKLTIRGGSEGFSDSGVIAKFDDRSPSAAPVVRSASVKFKKQNKEEALNKVIPLKPQEAESKEENSSVRSVGTVSKF
jgi:hypothetical protein